MSTILFTEQILEQTSDSIIAFNINKEIIFFNRAAEITFGYKKDEILSKNIATIIPNTINLIGDGLNESINEIEALRKDGTKFWINISISKVNTNNELQYTAFIRDISEQKKQKAEFDQYKRELEVRMQQVSTACLVSETDLKGNITYVNEKFCDVAKYKPEELIGKPHNIVRHPDMPKEAFKQMWATIGRGEIFRAVVKNRAKDGTPYWVDAIIAPVLGENGKPIKYIGIRYDITETVLQQENLKAAMEEAIMIKEKNESSLDQAIDAIVTINQNKEITFFNKAAEAMFGYTKNEVIGKNVSMIVPFEHRASHDKYVEDNIRTGINKVIGVGRDLEASHRDGSKFWINLSLSKIEFKGETIFTAFIKNVDMQKQIIKDVNRVINIAGKEGKLDAKIELENATGDWKELSDSINSLLHSISNPVIEFQRIIGLMSEGNLSQRFSLDVNGDFKKMAEGLNTALNNMSSLLNNITMVANLVASSAEQLLTKGEQMKGTTQEVASATQEMAEGAHQQAQQTDESSKRIDEVLKSSTEMGKKAEYINSAADRGQKSASDGLLTIRRLVSNMQDIQSSADTTSTSINILTERSEEIASTLNVITDIASQTNLLALNAAIEAARAGDAGRGFAVVAEEIRKLAEDSRKSAINIERVIKEVQKDILSAGKSIETMEGSVKSGNSASKEAEIVFQSIEKTSLETYELSKEIVNATAIQKDAINDTVKNIEKIVVVSEQTASGTEEIASSSKDLSQGMNEVTATSRDLADVANQLLSNVGKFILK